MKLPPVSPEKVNLKAIMCSSYNKYIFKGTESRRRISKTNASG